MSVLNCGDILRKAFCCCKSKQKATQNEVSVAVRTLKHTQTDTDTHANVVQSNNVLNHWVRRNEYEKKKTICKDNWFVMSFKI